MERANTAAGNGTEQVGGTERSDELDELLRLLDVQPDGPGCFRGDSPADRGRTVFGGQLIAQALIAAGRTVQPGRGPHSMHAYFLRPGDPRRPLIFTVEAVRDGRNYHHRQVSTHQDGKEVFRLVAGFTAGTDGPQYQAAPTPEPTPEPLELLEPIERAVPPDPAHFADYAAWTMAAATVPYHPWQDEATPLQITFQNAPDVVSGEPVGGPLRMWMRLKGAVPGDDPTLHAALLAWISDKTLADLAILVHGRRWVDDGVTSLSLDHAMWFLEPARADGWLRFDQEVERTAGGRGLVRGAFFDAAGRHIATAAQEAVVGLGP